MALPAVEVPDGNAVAGDSPPLIYVDGGASDGSADTNVAASVEAGSSPAETQTEAESEPSPPTRSTAALGLGMLALSVLASAPSSHQSSHGNADAPPQAIASWRQRLARLDEDAYRLPSWFLDLDDMRQNSRCQENDWVAAGGHTPTEQDFVSFVGHVVRRKAAVAAAMHMRHPALIRLATVKPALLKVRRGWFGGADGTEPIGNVSGITEAGLLRALQSELEDLPLWDEELYAAAGTELRECLNALIEESEAIIQKSYAEDARNEGLVVWTSRKKPKPGFAVWQAALRENDDIRATRKKYIRRACEGLKAMEAGDRKPARELLAEIAARQTRR